MYVHIQRIYCKGTGFATCRKDCTLQLHLPVCMGVWCTHSHQQTAHAHARNCWDSHRPLERISPEHEKFSIALYVKSIKFFFICISLKCKPHKIKCTHTHPGDWGKYTDAYLVHFTQPPGSSEKREQRAGLVPLGARGDQHTQKTLRLPCQGLSSGGCFLSCCPPSFRIRVLLGT